MLCEGPHHVQPSPLFLPSRLGWQGEIWVVLTHSGGHKGGWNLSINNNIIIN